MTDNKTSKLSSWVLWGPLKSAIVFLALIFICAMLMYNIAIPAIRIATPIITLVLGILLLIKFLPKTKYIDRRSFILTTNTIWIIGTIVIAITAPIVAAYQIPELQPTDNWLMPILTLFLVLIIGMYALGMMFTAIYLTFYRLRTLNIPTWKIILAYPLGVSALSAMAYILDTPDKKATNIETKSGLLNKMTDWTMARPRNAIITYTTILLASNLFTNGLPALLLNIVIILILALTVVNVGQKNFLKNIGGKYATLCVILNLFIIGAATLFFTMVPAITDAVTPNINDTQPNIEESL